MSLYVLYPLLSKSVRKHPHITILTMLFVSLMSRAVLGQFDILPTRPLDWFPLCRVFEFTVGVYSAVLIRRNFWSCINGHRKLNSMLRFMAEIAFPLFLVHWALIRIIGSHAQIGISQTTAIIAFFVLSVIASWIILVVTQAFLRLPRVQKILQPSRTTRG